jgi:DNA-binding IclR family transcriptional regulator
MHFVTHLPEERLWGIGIAAFEIGSGYLRSGVLERSARPLLAKLTQHTQMTSHLGVLHGPDVLYLLKQTTAEPARPFITAVGVRLPAHLTAVGRAILSELPVSQIYATVSRQSELVTRTDTGPRRMSELKSILQEDRFRGYSMESNTTTEQVTCIAAAVFDHESMPIASIGVSYYDDVRSLDVDRVASAVRETATNLTARLRGAEPNGTRLEANYVMS